MTWNSTAPDGTKSVKANEAILQANTTYTEGKLTLDHYWNEDANKDGHHKKIEMTDQASDPAISASLDAVMFLKENINSEMYLRNDDSIVQLLGIRACAVFNALGVLAYSYNVASVTQVGGAGLYTITYTTALPSNSYLVLGGAIRNEASLTGDLLFSMQGSTSLNTVKSTLLSKVLFKTASGTGLNPLQGWVVCFGG